MDIQFRCTSHSNFDQKTGVNKPCQQLLQASEDQSGMKIRCPRCNQTMAVPPIGRQSSKRVSEKRDTSRMGESVAHVESDMAYGKFDKKVRCPKCGSLLDAQRNCTACRYKSPIVKASRSPIEQMVVKPAGFQLWFRGIMSDSVGPTVFEVALHSLLGIFVLLCIGAAVVLGGSNALIIVCVAALLAFFYIMIVMGSKRMARVPGARLPFFLKPFWWTMLKLARTQQWQRYDSSLKGRIIIDVRKEPFGDRDLLELHNLNMCQVLDAEGTALTDNALAAMHGLKHLRCLVLRKTHVSHDAVFRLQQSIPRCWIWY